MIGTFGNKVLSEGFIDNLNQSFRARCIDNFVEEKSAIESNTNAADILENTMFAAGILVADTNGGEIIRNSISQASTVSLASQTSSGHFISNNVSGGSVVNADNNAGTISFNVVESQSTILATNNLGTIGPGNDNGGNHLTSGILTATNQTVTGHFNGNLIKSSGAISIAQNESIVAGNFLHTAGTMSVAVNQSRIERCEIGNQRGVVITSPNTLARLNYRVLNGYSNWEETLDLSDGAIWATNDLTIPITFTHVGIFKLSNSNKTVETILNLPLSHDSRFETLTNLEVTTVTTVLVGAALINEIIAAQAAGGIQITGRTSGTDDIVFRRLGNFNGVIGRPNVYQ